MNNNTKLAQASDKGQSSLLRWVLGLLYGACLLLLVADFVWHRHIEHPLENLPGFYAVFGFVGCVSLVLVAKELRRWVKRRKDYYDA